MVLSNNDYIKFEDLPEDVKEYEEEVCQGNNIFSEDLVGMPLKEIEAIVLKATLIKNGGHIRDTAKMLGISEKGLRNKIHSYNIIV